MPDALLAELTRRDWVVYAKTPFAGPAQVLAYLGRYTHRTAIGNQRLVALADGQVKFRQVNSTGATGRTATRCGS